MPFTSAQDIISQALFRAGEIAGSSDWDAPAIDYLNRNYLLLCAGASELLSENVEDWWWLRERGVLTLLPVYRDGTVSLTKDSSSITFTPAPAIDLTGRRLKLIGHPDIFLIQTHSPGAAAATLDSPYTGDTNTANEFQAMKTTYTLASAVSAIISPVISFRENPQIMGMQPERMDLLYPLGRLQPGVPQAFALDNTQTVRFSHGGMLENDRSMRMEYRYRPAVTELQNISTSIPLLPIQYRPILVEMILIQLYSDKNDDRITIATSAARAGLQAMAHENKRQLIKMDGTTGAIITRPGQTWRHYDRQLRTESGLIVG